MARNDLAWQSSHGAARKVRDRSASEGSGTTRQGSQGAGVLARRGRDEQALDGQGSARRGLGSRGTASRGPDAKRSAGNGRTGQSRRGRARSVAASKGSAGKGLSGRKGAASAAPAYSIKDGARVPKKYADALAATIDQLTRQGRGSDAELVEEARSSKSPIHGAFEWNDAKAAQAHRLEQARHYWKAFVIHVEDVSEPVRAFHPVFVAGERRYEHIGTIARDEDLTAQLLKRAGDDLKAFKNRYAVLREVSSLRGVFNAIDKFEEAAE